MIHIHVHRKALSLSLLKTIRRTFSVVFHRLSLWGRSYSFSSPRRLFSPALFSSFAPPVFSVSPLALSPGQIHPRLWFWWRRFCCCCFCCYSFAFVAAAELWSRPARRKRSASSSSSSSCACASRCLFRAGIFFVMTKLEKFSPHTHHFFFHHRTRKIPLTTLRREQEKRR